LDLSQVAVVILNYNGKSWLEKFLPFVVRYSGNARIVVADNHSTDDSVNFLKENYSTLNLIEVPSNRGFCGGYNFALKQVNEKYYVLLNSDVEVTPGWIEPVIQLFESNSKIAAVQPKILSYTDKSLFEYAGAAGGFIDTLGYPFCRGRIFNNLEKDRAQYDDIRQIFWATGACLFIRNECYHQLNGLDEDFFAHMEEIDLCWKLNRAGQRVCYCGQSTIYHLGAGTLGYHSPRKTYLNFRNGLSLLFKHLDAAELWYKLPIRLGLDWLAAVVFLLKGQPLNFHAVGKAHLHFIRHYARDKRKRHIIHKQYPRYSRKTVYPGCIVFDVYVKGKKKIDPVDQ